MGKNLTTTSAPKTGGPLFRGEVGSTLPTDAVSELDSAFTNLGRISDDGAKVSDSISTDEIKDWEGIVVATPVKEKKDELEITLIESLNVEVLKTVYGSDNVSGTLETGITVKSNPHNPKHYAYVLDTIEGEDADILHRKVYPNAAITKVGDQTYVNNKLVSYQVTITALGDENGNTRYDYYKKKGASTESGT